MRCECLSSSLLLSFILFSSHYRYSFCSLFFPFFSSFTFFALFFSVNSFPFLSFLSLYCSLLPHFFNSLSMHPLVLSNSPLSSLQLFSTFYTSHFSSPLSPPFLFFSFFPLHMIFSSYSSLIEFTYFTSHRPWKRCTGKKGSTCCAVNSLKMLLEGSTCATR